MTLFKNPFVKVRNKPNWGIEKERRRTMKTLVVGATGATGSLLVKELLERNQKVKVIVRSPEKVSEEVKNNPNFTLVEASLLDLSDEELKQHVADCDAIASCLGHTLNFKGIYGQPRRLVTDATRRLCNAAIANNSKTSVKFVLMNTSGNSNRDLNEPVTTAQSIVVNLLRLLLPPHPDNEQAADYLRTEIDRNASRIEWIAVRPDDLINEASVSEYEVYPSPTRNPIFNSGKTSKINVAHLMAQLITDEDLWQEWLWQMPVIYNKGFS